MNITYKLFTNVGERDNNEDNLGMMEMDGKFCFVVADGLGGHDKGEVASELVVRETMKYFCEHYSEETFLGDAIQKAQNDLMDLQKQERAVGQMKTTIVALTIEGNKAQWAHVGDTRLYHFEKAKLRGQTLDHSVPQMLASSGQIREKEIRNHPDRNRLLRVMGSEWDNPRYEVSQVCELNVKKQNAFLMCTDGFWELITEKEMSKCLKSASSVDEWISKMADIVAKNGKGTRMDNYTAIGVFVE